MERDSWICDTHDGQWRLDSKNECVNIFEWFGWAIRLFVVFFSVFVGEAMVRCNCETEEEGTIFNIVKKIPRTYVGNL